MKNDTPKYQAVCRIRVDDRIFFALCWPVSAQIRSNYWKNVDGVYSVPANWTDDSFYPSTTNDYAFFVTGATNHIIFTDDETACSAQVRGATVALLDLNGNTYTLASTGSGMGATAALVVGHTGYGTLVVTNGQLVARALGVGLERFATGRLLVSGADTTMSIGLGGATLISYVGISQDESVLSVEAGAQVTLHHQLRIGRGGNNRFGALMCSNCHKKC